MGQLKTVRSVGLKPTGKSGKGGGKPDHGLVKTILLHEASISDRVLSTIVCGFNISTVRLSIIVGGMPRFETMIFDSEGKEVLKKVFFKRDEAKIYHDLAVHACSQDITMTIKEDDDE